MRENLTTSHDAAMTGCIPIGRATVQIALLDVMRKPSSRSFWSGKKRLRIITGMGHNSKDGEARIKVHLPLS